MSTSHRFFLTTHASHRIRERFPGKSHDFLDWQKRSLELVQADGAEIWRMVDGDATAWVICEPKASGRTVVTVLPPEYVLGSVVHRHNLGVQNVKVDTYRGDERNVVKMEKGRSRLPSKKRQFVRHTEKAVAKRSTVLDSIDYKKASQLGLSIEQYRQRRDAITAAFLAKTAPSK